MLFLPDFNVFCRVSGAPQDMTESLVFQDSQESQGPQDIPQE